MTDEGFNQAVTLIEVVKKSGFGEVIVRIQNHKVVGSQVSFNLKPNENIPEIKQ